MVKGTNTIIKETKDAIVKAINDSKLPIGVIDLMIDNIMYEVKNGLNRTLESEQIEYNKLLKAQEEQVEWIDPVNEN